MFSVRTLQMVSVAHASKRKWTVSAVLLCMFSDPDHTIAVLSRRHLLVFDSGPSPACGSTELMLAVDPFSGQIMATAVRCCPGSSRS